MTVKPEVQQIIGPLGASPYSGQSGDSCWTLRTVLGLVEHGPMQAPTCRWRLTCHCWLSFQFAGESNLQASGAADTSELVGFPDAVAFSA